MKSNEYFFLDGSILLENEWWFYTVDGGNVQRVNLPIFYYFGKTLKGLRNIKKTDGKDFTDLIPLIIGKMVIQNFLEATANMAFSLSRTDAMALNDALEKALKNRTIDGEFIKSLNRQADEFETVFKREARRVSAFTITPKGIYDTEKLIDEGEKKFPPELLAVMHPRVIEDIQEASRCLAFERATACAFHICRATEGLMRAYYKKLTGNDWPPPPPKPPMRKDWAVLVDQLEVEGAPKKIIERLKELREDRNSYAHPDVTVPTDEASIVYETCTFAMFYIAKEMV